MRNPAPNPRRPGDAAHGDLDRWLVEGLRDHAVFFVGCEGRIESWSRGAERIHGWRADAIVGRPIDVLYAPEDIAAGEPACSSSSAERIGLTVMNFSYQ